MPARFGPDGVMHPGQIHVADEQVRRLVDTQFPQWAGQSLSRVAESGTDHTLFRLGEDLLVRLPIIEWAAAQTDSDQRWLPLLAPQLPLRIPVPIAVGRPGQGYPWRWSVVSWIPGNPASAANHDRDLAARDLAAFLHALHGIPASGGPVKSGTSRGSALAPMNEDVLRLVDSLASDVDAPAIRRIWAEAVAAPAWDLAPVWIHGDVAPGNLLVHDRRLTAVIDFGGLGLGDPAADLVPAWNLFASTSRSVFRQTIDADDAAWSRAKGWVLVPALQGLRYYERSRPDLSAAARTRITAVLADS